MLQTGPGGKSYYVPESYPPKIFVGQDYNMAEASIAFVHEMNHVEQALIKGTTSKATNLGRPEFILQRCAEEAQGVAREVRHGLDLRRADPGRRSATRPSASTCRRTTPRSRGCARPVRACPPP